MAIPVIDANIPQRQIQFILFCFYVITKERLDIEFIALNCSINQKTHNNMSVNVFPLSHQVGTIWRHTCSSHTCFPPKVPLCNPALHPASVAPFKQADYTGTFYDDGDNRDAKSHRLRNLCFIYRRRNRNPWINNNPRISILCQFNEFLIFH